VAGGLFLGNFDRLAISVIKTSAGSDEGRSMEGVEVSPAQLGAALARSLDRAKSRRLRAMVDAYWDFAARLLRNLGVPEADLDDGLQQVFLVAAGKLDEIRPESERAFLAQTSVHIAARVRRALARTRAREVLDDDGEEPGDPSGSTPEELVDQSRALQRLDRVLAAMDMELRSVFILHEIEEMTMADIAAALAIPAGTVASRLRRAREVFRERVAALAKEGRR
jgi:RNA polymerase sigma-70 factor (ECF subfamily)